MKKWVSYDGKNELNATNPDLTIDSLMYDYHQNLWWSNSCYSYIYTYTYIRDTPKIIYIYLINFSTQKTTTATTKVSSISLSPSLLLEKYISHYYYSDDYTHDIDIDSSNRKTRPPFLRVRNIPKSYTKWHQFIKYKLYIYYIIHMRIYKKFEKTIGAVDVRRN